LRLTYSLLFLFPQYPLAARPHPAATSKQPGNGTPLFNVIDPAFGLKDSPQPTTLFLADPNTVPLNEAPEPAALLSGVLGSALASVFACCRRVRRL
jgi:hypothetical protein